MKYIAIIAVRLLKVVLIWHSLVSTERTEENLALPPPAPPLQNIAPIDTMEY